MGRRTSGLYSGWGSYRHGDRRSKSKRQPRIFEGAQRMTMIDRTAAVLRMGTFSKFEFEGACRTALRQSLVLDGHQWETADFEARSIVTAALDNIGAVRPVGLEAKPEYTIARENCQRCGRELDVDQIVGHRTYCSNECRESARMYRYDLFVLTENLARASAAYIDAKALIPVKACEHCGTIWKPAVAHARYCSICSRLARGDLVPDRECDQCGKTYHPPTITAPSRFCSTECAAESKRVIHSRECTVCGTTFTPQRDSQTACSRACSRVEPGKLPEIPCIVCGAEFNPKTPWGKFCGPTCRNQHNHALERERKKSKALT